MTPKGLKLLKFLHFITVFMWIGGAVAMMVTMLAVPVSEPAEMRIRAAVLKAIDGYLVTPGAISCVVIGILYGVFTSWGFIKKGWIAAKWIFTIIMILSGTFAMGPCVHENVHIADPTLYHRNVEQTLFWGWIQIALLSVTVILSVWKIKFRNKGIKE